MATKTRQQMRQKARQQAKRSNTAAVRSARGSDPRLRNALLLVGLVVALVAALVIVKLTSGKTVSSTAKSTLAPASVLADVASVPTNELAASAAAKPTGLVPITGPAYTVGGKPAVLYVGAEYCPFCAAERWAMVTALSKFGTFANLGATHSSASDSYPNTATFSFHGATYSSAYLSFTGRETATNQPQGSSYAPLDTLTAAEQHLVDTYDAPPYVSSSSAGAIPFIDFGGRFVQSGASYSPSVLQGKTLAQIGAALRNPKSDISKAIYASAGAFTRDLCKLTGNKPASVCHAFATS